MKKTVVTSLAGIVLILFVISSCLPESTPPDYNAQLESNVAAVNQTRLKEDTVIIIDSLNRWIDKGLITGPILKDSKDVVRYTIQTAGPSTEVKPTLSSYIVVNYTGKRLSDGFVFDQSKPGEPLGIYLHQLIIGWQTTLPLLTKGTKATLYIPSGFAYGTREIRNQTTGAVMIPSNSNLIFEIEILGVY
ncbi:MAG: FKBP-type peptidyl-prolyl cis-trans isomerase [Cyclobacteriaceae bacterium]|nr:FKBP-type peptidyl-prolyl cis-trans isomerase [Cyclobacteriaceae bacterium]